MPGPLPKPPGIRQRRNRVVTSASLPSARANAKRKVPPLPKREASTEVWHERVIEWWKSVWTSPMAGEYLGPDMKGGLYLLAELHQRRWTEKDTKVLVALASEIRQQEVRFGLSPIDRRRLQWEIDKGEEAEEKVQKRRKLKKLEKVSTKDPRDVLRMV